MPTDLTSELHPRLNLASLASGYIKKDFSDLMNSTTGLLERTFLTLKILMP